MRKFITFVLVITAGFYSPAVIPIHVYSHDPNLHDRPSDANNDGKVDGLDYVVWLNGYNSQVQNGTEDGDYEGNGRVDGLDYVVWLNSYGSGGNTPTVTPAITNPTPTKVAGGLSGVSHWHTPGAHDGLNVHEHGDQAPSWAEDFAVQNFGHGVEFGGDEATPNENLVKHQAYKGFTMKASGVDMFIRYHNMSNPHDRSGPLHSYEVYAKDGSNNISFWQGWIFHGYPENRSQRMTRRNEQPGFDPTNGITWPGRDQFIIAAPDHVDWDNNLRCEQWYGHGGLWGWDLSLTICGATTFYKVDEHTTDFTNKSTWELTGALGNSRRMEVTHYGPSNPRVQGLNLPTDQWFCVEKIPNQDGRASGADPVWKVGSTVSGPTTCPSGSLPQFIAGTFPKTGVYFETGNTAEKTFPVPGVSVPN